MKETLDIRKVILQRDYEDASGTHGRLFSEYGDFLGVYTLEEPWKENARRVSCIPAGEYRCKDFSGMKFQDVWQVLNVPNRDAILIHAGNTIRDTEGCILVGLTRRKDGVGSSRDALMWLRTHLPSEFTLRVRSPDDPKSEE